MAELERNIKLIVEYNGSEYAGWQRQPNDNTVQGEIEMALQNLTKQKTAMYAAGRTDAGVHALGQVVNFSFNNVLPVQKIRDALNFYLPNDILIRSVEEVPPDFHARYNAVSRRYQYLVGLEKSALYRNMRWELSFPVDYDLLVEAAEYIKGEHDFATFCVVSSQKENNNCIVYQSEWTKLDKALKYEITANRFLHSMIRSLVGLMISLANGKINFQRFKEVFNSGDHTALPKIAPARGLCLVGVEY
ncbi:MAG: tRNA pseudouridine(38-40) synthase TruA [candidate division Zixibacteria bacterium]|nr:tRNA pseudouridine(38-40) synthase TruA [candidate division Zixibacteria bacterium]